MARAGFPHKNMDKRTLGFQSYTGWASRTELMGLDWRERFKGSRSPDQKCVHFPTLFRSNDGVYVNPDDHIRVRITIEPHTKFTKGEEK